MIYIITVILAAILVYVARLVNDNRRRVPEDNKHTIYTELLHRSCGRKTHGTLSKYSDQELEELKEQLKSIVTKRRAKVALTKHEKKLIAQFPNSFSFAKLKD